MSIVSRLQMIAPAYTHTHTHARMERRSNGYRIWAYARPTVGYRLTVVCWVVTVLLQRVELGCVAKINLSLEKQEELNTIT